MNREWLTLWPAHQYSPTLGLVPKHKECHTRFFTMNEHQHRWTFIVCSSTSIYTILSELAQKKTGMFSEFCASLSLLREQPSWGNYKKCRKKKNGKITKKNWKAFRTRVTENWHMEIKHRFLTSESLHLWDSKHDMKFKQKQYNYSMPAEACAYTSIFNASAEVTSSVYK